MDPPAVIGPTAASRRYGRQAGARREIAACYAGHCTEARPKSPRADVMPAIAPGEVGGCDAGPPRGGHPARSFAVQNEMSSSAAPLAGSAIVRGSWLARRPRLPASRSRRPATPASAPRTSGARPGHSQPASDAVNASIDEIHGAFDTGWWYGGSLPAYRAAQHSLAGDSECRWEAQGAVPRSGSGLSSPGAGGSASTCRFGDESRTLAAWGRRTPTSGGSARRGDALARGRTSAPTESRAARPDRANRADPAPMPAAEGAPQTTH
jgi:hypothetical protein